MKRSTSIIAIVLFLVLLCGMVAVPAQAAISNGSTFSVSGLAISDDNSSAITWNVTRSNALSVDTGGFNRETRTGTLTITNNTESEAVVSFDLAYFLASGGDGGKSWIKINGTTFATTEGAGTFAQKTKGDSNLQNHTPCKYTVAAGSKITIQVSATGGVFVQGQAKLAISNVALKVKTTAAVTFASNSVVSYNVGYVDGDGVAQTAAVSAGGNNVTVDAELTEDVTITPTTEGYACESAVGTTSGTIYVDADSKFTVAKNETVTPVFISSSSVKPFTHLGNSKSYHTLGAAAKAGYGTVVLNQDYTLPAGDYIIPKGVTLLIPCDSANTVYTTKPGDDGDDTYVATSVYRKLTMAQGANITVNGAISLGGKIGTNMTGEVVDPKYYFTNGAPSGPLGYIAMNDGSSITVVDGGNLYAWGFITGSGNVTVKNGGTVYENLQIRDWRGGNCTFTVVGAKDTYHVFPFSQYYIQNIEVPLTLETGATEKVCTAMTVTLIHVVKETATFAAKDEGLIRLTGGSLTRTYDGSTDRVTYNLSGKASISNLSISINTGIYGKITINSKDYVMPINSNMTLNMESGSEVTLDQDIAFLPGAAANVNKGANCTVGSGKKIIVYDADEWGTYSGAHNLDFSAVYFAPGKTYDRTSDDLVDGKLIVDGTLDASKGSIYTTSGGANITSTDHGKINTTKGTETVTYQITQTGSDPSYPEISIIPAKLKNADGNHIQSDTNSYTYTAGKWVCKTHTPGEWVTDSEPTCAVAGSKHTTCTVCLTKITESIPATGAHSFTNYVSDGNATCGADGTKTATCDNCTATDTKSDEGSATGNHSGGKATCSAKAVCDICEHPYGELDADNHVNTTTINTKDATEFEPGYTGDTFCNDCEQIIATGTEIPASHKHSFGENWESDATGHWHACTCGAKDAFAEHISGGEATEDAAEVCTVCDYEIASKLDHVHGMIKTEAQDPTCATPGNSEYWTCAGCGKYFSDEAAENEIDEDSWIIPALNHVGTTVTYTDNGDGTHDGTCSCGEVVVDNQAHSFDDPTGKCVCGAMKEPEELVDPNLIFYSDALELEAYIGASFAVRFGKDCEYDSFYIVIEREGEKPKKVTQYTDITTSKYTYRGFTLKTAAKEMGDKMTITLYGTKNGKDYKGESYCNWSVASKIYSMLQERTSKTVISAEDEKLCAMLIAMLNYGAEAQKAFIKDLSPEELVNLNVGQYAEYATAQLPNIQNTSTVTENGLNTVTLIKSALGLESIIQLQPAFVFPDSNFGEYTAKFVRGDNITDTTIESLDYKTWGVAIYEKLQAKEMNTKISVTIYRDGAAVSETYCFSIMDFAAGMIGGSYDALVKAMLTYGAAAETYFN